jgi:hypothetical protein
LHDILFVYFRETDMMKRVIFLVCLVIAGQALAQQDRRLVLYLFPPDSCSQMDSTARQASIDSAVARVPAKEQVTLTDWLRREPCVHEPVTETEDSVFLPWDSVTVLHWKDDGVDSFLVSVSRTGCPGTETEPSVAVTFPAGTGWSSPPIHFGPLGGHVICPLGRELVLEVFGENPAGSSVRLRHREAVWSSRK